MFDLDKAVATAVAGAAPYRWVIQQATCRACGNVHEREIGLMKEHAPGSWIRVLEQSEQAAHLNAPIEFQPTVLAWCEGCHSKAAAELTIALRLGIDKYANTTALAAYVQGVMNAYERARQKEHFHHATQQEPRSTHSTAG